MTGKWVDLVVMAFVAFSVIRGFRRGFIREVFSLVGSLIAVVLAFQGYQELAYYLIVAYPLLDWQAQLLAFFVLVLGISILAVFFGFLWARAIRLTPFALLDNLAGAGFGVIKVGVIVVISVVLLGSLGVAPVDHVLEESITAHQVIVVWPVIHQKLEIVWPMDWPKPGWLFPNSHQTTYEKHVRYAVILNPALRSGV